MSGVFERGRTGDYKKLASARWAYPEGVRKGASHYEGALKYEPGKIWLGVTPDEDEFPVGWKDDRHLVTIAGSRAGKGRSAIIPNLLIYPGSVICIDPKGENARFTAAIRAAPAEEGGLGQRVYVFDPFNSSEAPESTKACFNPLALLNTSEEDVVERVGIIADSMVVQTDAKDAHWDETARSLIEGLILHVITSPDFKNVQSLKTVRELLLHGDRRAAAQKRSQEFVNVTTDIDSPENDDVEYPDDDWKPDSQSDPETNEISPFLALLEEMISSEAFPNSIAGLAQSLLDMAPEERGSVLSTARRNTKFLDSVAINRVLGNSLRPFSFDILKKAVHGATVYLCLPTRYLNTHARWLRLMVASLFDAMERNYNQPKCGHPVLAIFDEFPVLGYLKSVETAAGYLVGYGMRLWAIIQDISQLRRDYPKSWETFLGNAGLIQFFANSDYSTLEFLSKRLGETEVIRELSTKGKSEGYTEQDLSEDDKRIRQRDKSTRAGFFEHQVDTISRATKVDCTESQTEHVFKTLLMTPGEIAYEFRRISQLQGVICADAPPMYLRRVNYDRKDFQEKWRNWRMQSNRSKKLR